MSQRKQQMQLRKQIQPFTKSDTITSIFQIMNTILPLLLTWFLAYKSLAISIWLALPFIVLAAGLLIRTFIIFHDCTHGSYFKSSKANRYLGTITGILTLFSFEKWKRSHAIHHATSGNLDKLGTGDVWIMTVEEYLQASRWQRLSYRLYRNPIVMFGLGPLYLYFIANRFNRKGANKRERLNTYFTNIAIVLLHGTLIWAVGLQAYLIVQLPILLIAGSLGIWLFYIQHQFEDSYFENESEWSFVKAAIDGSSYYKLPKVLQWMTGNIGFHHVHHLSPKVPNYHLEKVHESVPPLQEATTVTLKSSLPAIRFRLYDEENRRFIGFKEVKSLQKKRKLGAILPPNRSTIQEK